MQRALPSTQRPRRLPLGFRSVWRRWTRRWRPSRHGRTGSSRQGRRRQAPAPPHLRSLPAGSRQQHRRRRRPLGNCRIRRTARPGGHRRDGRVTRQRDCQARQEQCRGDDPRPPRRMPSGSHRQRRRGAPRFAARRRRPWQQRPSGVRLRLRPPPPAVQSARLPRQRARHGRRGATRRASLRQGPRVSLGRRSRTLTQHDRLRQARLRLQPLQAPRRGARRCAPALLRHRGTMTASSTSRAHPRRGRGRGPGAAALSRLSGCGHGRAPRRLLHPVPRAAAALRTARGLSRRTTSFATVSSVRCTAGAMRAHSPALCTRCGRRGTSPIMRRWWTS